MLDIVGGATTVTVGSGSANNFSLTDLSDGKLVSDTELMLVKGDGSTTYSGVTLGANSALYGRLITGGFSLADNSFLQDYSLSQLYEKKRRHLCPHRRARAFDAGDESLG